MTSRIVVRGEGRLTWRDKTYRCALGAAGITAAKREGDKATPAGIFPLRRLLYRPDRINTPKTALPTAPIGPDDGWCDDPADANYNRPVQLPYPGHHERLWRDDHVYDLVAVLGHNDDPVVPGAGSAIFLHIARPDYAPTEGCIALSQPDLMAVLASVTPSDEIEIRG